MTSTGRGVSHSEYNRHSQKQVHFLQIWAIPSQMGLEPKYYRRNFPRAEKLNKLCKVVDTVGRPGVIDERHAKGPTPVHSKLSMSASILEAKQSVTATLADSTTKVRSTVAVAFRSARLTKLSTRPTFT